LRTSLFVNGAATAHTRRLPRGRHGLSRKAVVRSQRERLLRAMAETMARQGYARTSVADVLRAAGVSRETFYEQFSSKEDCFMAAYDAAAELVLADIPRAPAGGSTTTRQAAFGRGIGAYLDALAAEPDFARLFLVEVYAAGPGAIARRMAMQERFVDVLSDQLDPRGDERFAVEALVAAIAQMVTSRLAVGDVDGLRKLRRPLTKLVSRALDADA
jgi:AcrR family transcriptional regulator